MNKSRLNMLNKIRLFDKINKNVSKNIKSRNNSSSFIFIVELDWI